MAVIVIVIEIAGLVLYLCSLSCVLFVFCWFLSLSLFLCFAFFLFVAVAGAIVSFVLLYWKDEQRDLLKISARQDVALAEAVKENSLALLDGWNLKRKAVTWKIPGKCDIADNKRLQPSHQFWIFCLWCSQEWFVKHKGYRRVGSPIWMIFFNVSFSHLLLILTPHFCVGKTRPLSWVFFFLNGGTLRCHSCSPRCPSTELLMEAAVTN